MSCEDNHRGGVWGRNVEDEETDDEMRDRSKLSFLYESAATTETIGRYSFVGAGAFSLSILGLGAESDRYRNVYQTPIKSSRPVLAMAPHATLFLPWRANSPNTVLRQSLAWSCRLSPEEPSVTWGTTV